MKTESHSTLKHQELAKNNAVFGVLINLNEGSAIKFISHRKYDALLCKHVYMRFCPDCPQYECEKREARAVTVA